MQEAYEDLPIIPHLVAYIICRCRYTGSEQRNLSGDEINRIEILRQQMDDSQLNEFVDACDRRCKAAWETQADWFVRCVRSKNKTGLDQIYIWISHWLASYLTNPSKFMEKSIDEE
jgi:hypothetical protein